MIINLSKTINKSLQRICVGHDYCWYFIEKCSYQTGIKICSNDLVIGKKYKQRTVDSGDKTANLFL